MKPNLLGRAMRYVYEARLYALGEVKASLGQGMFSAPLATMADRAHYETITTDSAAAERLAITSSWVWSDISLLGDRVASEEWEVKRRVGEDLEDENNHPFEVLWQRPGGTFSGALISKYLVWWYLLRGESFLFVATDAPGRGEPKELWPLVAADVTPLPKTLRASVLTGHPIIDYEYRVSGSVHTLPGENVAHFRFPNPWDFWRGLSPMTAASQGVELDTGARRWQRDFYRKDNAVPVALVQTHPDINDGDFLSLVTDIKEQINLGQRLLFGRSGDLDIKTVQQSIHDMQVLETRGFTRDEIDRIYHVPSGIFTGGNSGDAQQAMEITLARNAVQPLLDYFAAELTYKIAPYYGEDIVIAAPNVVPQDRALEAQEYSIYRLERTMDENRAEQNLDELTDLDKLTVAGVPIRKVPLRILDLASAGQVQIKDETEPEPDPSPVPPQLAGFAGQDNQGNGEQPEEPAGPPSMIGSESPEQTAESLTRAAWLGVETELGRWERVAVKELREGRDPAEREFETDVIPAELCGAIKMALVLADTEAQVKAAFSHPFVTKATRITAGGAKDPNGDEKDRYENRVGRILRVNLNGHLDRIMDKLGEPPDMNRLDAAFWTDEERNIIRAIRPELEAMAGTAAEQMLSMLPVGFEWGLVAEDAADWAGRYAYDLVRGIDNTTQRVLQKRVREYVQEQMTIGELRQSLEPWFGKTRANTIAVTEVTRAFSQGHNIAVNRARQVGMVLEDVWQTNNDELVCTICGPNHDKRKSEGWTVADVPAHPNCILPGNKVIAPGGVTAAAKSFYVGRAIEIRLANGSRLTVTENHPILTRRGWVAAKFIGQGDDVFYCADPQGIAAAIDPDDDQVPTVIEEVFSARKEALTMATVAMPLAAEDLHGDGQFVKGNIDVVYPNGLLLSNGDPAFLQRISKSEFGGGGVTEVGLDAFGAGTQVGTAPRCAADGIVGGRDLGGAFVGGHTRPLDGLGIGAATGVDASLEQALAERPAIDARLAREFVLRFSSDVTMEQVVEVRYFDFADHVYDLQCDMYELYITSGVIVKNCRCWKNATWEVPNA